MNKLSAELSGFAPAAGSGASSSSETPASAAAGGAGAESAPAAAAAGAAPSPATKAAAPAPAAGPSKRAPKKRGGPKKGGAAASAGAGADAGGGEDLEEDAVVKPLAEVGPDFHPVTLSQIGYRMGKLLEALPAEDPDVPSDYDPANSAASNDEAHRPINAFASSLQVAIEQFTLLLALVPSVTYKWGVDRSGASQQNLEVMLAGLQQCQEVVTSYVSSRLSNVLCPAVDVLIGEVEIIRDGVKGGEDVPNGAAAEGATETERALEGAQGPTKKRKLLNEDRLSLASSKERRINHYVRPLVDPSYVHLSHCILARNASLIRHTVATQIHTAKKVLGDYRKAMKKDTSHEAGKGGYY
ncbi:hypothetical protein ACHAWF_005310 [Thalassiosira exigua]